MKGAGKAGFEESRGLGFKRKGRGIFSRLRYYVLDRSDFASVVICYSYFTAVTTRLLLRNSTREGFGRRYAFS